MRKWPKTIKIIWRRSNFQPKNFSANFVAIVVQDTRNELEYAKSAESDGLNLRKLTKTSFLGQFGHIWSILAPKHFFFQKSKNVTFLDLLKANLMQKIRKI